MVGGCDSINRFTSIREEVRYVPRYTKVLLSSVPGTVPCLDVPLSYRSLVPDRSPSEPVVASFQKEQVAFVVRIDGFQLQM